MDELKGTAARNVLTVLIVAVAMLTGCQAPSVPSGPLASPGVTSGPSASPASDWGPLAVVPPQDGSDGALATGTLNITERCVYLVSKGEKALLFWPADRTKWVEAERAISFVNFDGTVVTASDGDTVALGGGGDSAAESGISGRAWAGGLTWVAPPDPSCSAEVRFGVGGVKR